MPLNISKTMVDWTQKNATLTVLKCVSYIYMHTMHRNDIVCIYRMKNVAISHLVRELQTLGTPMFYVTMRELLKLPWLKLDQFLLALMPDGDLSKYATACTHKS